MTGKADYTEEEWHSVLEGPPSAGMLVIVAQRGGTFRETLSMGKAYTEARQQHGQSELLDDIVAAKPEIDHTRYHSPEEVREHALRHIRDAVAVLRAKAGPSEVEEFGNFVVGLAERVGRAHSEGDTPISEAEQSAIDAVREALAATD